MAENRSKSQEAAALLRRAASILTQNSAESEGCSSESTRNNNMGNTVRPIQPAPSQQATTSRPRASSHDEFRRLFAPYNRANNSSLVQQPPAKRGRGNSCSSISRQTRSFKPQDTWTHEFFCLANPLQTCALARAEKFNLQNAGLWRKRIFFHKNDDPLQFKMKLEKAYPNLASGGGFELLRNSVSPRDLDLIHPPKRGYSVPFLRDCSGGPSNSVPEANSARVRHYTSAIK